MKNILNNDPINEILDVFERKGNNLKFQDFRDSISKYNNEAGGSEKLRNLLNDMIDQQILTAHQEKGKNNKLFDLYSLNSGNSDNISSAGHINSVKTNPNDIDIISTRHIKIKIGAKIIDLLTPENKTVLDILASLINSSNGNGNSNSSDVIPDKNDSIPDNEDYTPEIYFYQAEYDADRHDYFPPRIYNAITGTEITLTTDDPQEISSIFTVNCPAE